MYNKKNYEYDNLLTTKANFYNCLLEVVRQYQNDNGVILSEDDLIRFNSSTQESLYWTLIKEAEASYYEQIEEQASGENVPFTYLEERAMRTKLRQTIDEIKRKYQPKIKASMASRKTEAKKLKKQIKELENEVIELDNKTKSASERKQLERKRKQLDELNEQIAELECNCPEEEECANEIQSARDEMEAEIMNGKPANGGGDKYKVTLSIEDQEDLFQMLLFDLNNEIQMIQNNATTFISDESKYKVALVKFVGMLNYADAEYATRIWDGWIRNTKYALSHLDNCRGFLINVVSESHKIGKSELLMTLASQISKVAKCPSRSVDLSQTLSQLNKWPATSGINYIDEIKSSTNFDAEFLKSVIANNELSLNLKYKASNVRTINHSGNLSTSNFEFSIARKNEEGIDCRVANLVVNGDQPKYKVKSSDTTYQADIEQLCYDLFLYAPFEYRDIDVLDIIASRYSSTAYQNFVRDFKIALNAFHYRQVPNDRNEWLTPDTFINYTLQAAGKDIGADNYVVGTKDDIARTLARVVNKGAGQNKIDREVHYIKYIKNIFTMDNEETMIYSISKKFINDVVSFRIKSIIDVPMMMEWKKSTAYTYVNDIDAEEYSEPTISAISNASCVKNEKNEKSNVYNDYPLDLFSDKIDTAKKLFEF